MLTVTEDACEYLFSALKLVRARVSPDACFRIAPGDDAESWMISISSEEDDDELANHGEETVLVWNPDDLTTPKPLVLTIDEADDEDPLLVMHPEKTGEAESTEVELEDRIIEIVDDAS